ncbi:MAG: DNA polymerase III subunit beta [Bifidobacteriaceae bacterium]|nr:DNA polymerase III subunit beta [Bifidobacteriaceae bacterium]
MKLEVNSQDFANAVNWTTHIISPRPAAPILAGVKLDAADGILNLSVFNYEVTARHHIEASIEEAGTIIVLGKLLADIAKNLPAEKTTLVTEGSRLIIRSGKSKFVLQLMPESDYPSMPEIPESIGQVDGETLAHAIAQASVSVAKNTNRPILTAILMEFNGNKVTMSSTDSFRVSQVTFSWTPVNPDIATSILVRGSLLSDVARTIDTTQNVTLSFDPDDPKLLAVENAGRVSTMQLMSSEFPNVGSMFPKEYPYQAVLNRNDVLGALQRVSLVSDHKSMVRFSFAHDGLTLYAGAADESQASETIPVDYDGEDLAVAFNPSNLVEGFKAIDEPYVRIKMVDAPRKDVSRKIVEINGQQEADSDESTDFRYMLATVHFSD